ncbi:hypothetical protein [Streptomyces avermitilis]|uniref:hypothetical protein n=1 Tax=Streptomyces avermitilis TaxID=33903 RepID=UPI00371BE1D8
MSYQMQYRTAMEEGATDYAQTIVITALQAAETGAITQEDVSELVTEIKAWEVEG